MSTKQAVAERPSDRHTLRTRELVLIGMFAAVLSVISQISLPMPSGVPVTIQLFGVALAGTVLGHKLGFLATVVYILIGAVGLPVFSGFRGGLAVLTGVTGGYILGWPVMAFLSGIRPNLNNKKLNLAVAVILSLAGLMFVEFTGALQWSWLSSDRSLAAIMVYSFVAFIPKDIVITILAVVLGGQMRRVLVKAGYLE